MKKGVARIAVYKIDPSDPASMWTWSITLSRESGNYFELRPMTSNGWERGFRTPSLARRDAIFAVAKLDSAKVEIKEEDHENAFVQGYVS